MDFDFRVRFSLDDTQGDLVNFLDNCRGAHSLSTFVKDAIVYYFKACKGEEEKSDSNTPFVLSADMQAALIGIISKGVAEGVRDGLAAGGVLSQSITPVVGGGAMVDNATPISDRSVVSVEEVSNVVSEEGSGSVPEVEDTVGSAEGEDSVSQENAGAVDGESAGGDEFTGDALAALASFFGGGG